VRTARFNRQIWIHMILPISPLLSLQERAHIMIVPIIIQPSILPFGIPVQPHTFHFHIGWSCPFRSCSGDFYQDRLVGIPFYCKDILELLASLHDQFGYGEGEKGEVDSHRSEGGYLVFYVESVSQTCRVYAIMKLTRGSFLGQPE
jgi:hypothetical protein